MGLNRFQGCSNNPTGPVLHLRRSFCISAIDAMCEACVLGFQATTYPRRAQSQYCNWCNSGQGFAHIQAWLVQVINARLLQLA